MASNPQTPTYAREIPKNGCGPRGYNQFYIPDWVDQIKSVEVVSSDTQIVITDNSNQSKYSFNVDYIPKVDLTAVLNLVAKKSGVVVPVPVLKGDTIDRVELTWTFNKAVATQSLDCNDAGITDPTLGQDDRAYNYTDESITENTSFALSADDGLNLDGSTVQVSKSLSFGNYYFSGAGASLIGAASTSVQAFLDSISKTIQTSRIRNLFATGGEDEFFFFAYPKAYGLPNDIKKGIFSGGYIRLLNVGGVLKTSLGQGETESDLNISNGIISEPYYLYMSLVDNQVDATIPIEIT